MTCLSPTTGAKQDLPRFPARRENDAQAADFRGSIFADGQHHRLFPQLLWHRLGRRSVCLPAPPANVGSMLPTVLPATLLRSLRHDEHDAGDRDDAGRSVLPIVLAVKTNRRGQAK